MFKIRRATVAADPPSPAATALLEPPSDEATAPGAAAKRVWLIRLADGTVRNCQELSTLQSWIVSGVLTRDCHISRTGKTWKPLGQISELAQYFDIADEAKRRGVSSRPQTESMVREPTENVALPSGRVQRSEPTPPPEPRATSPALDGVAAAAAVTPELSGPVVATDFDDEPRMLGDVVAPEAASSGWNKPRSAADSGPVGPIGGLAKAGPTTDVAFAKSKFTQSADDVADDLDGYRAPRKVGRWIALASIFVIAAAATAMWFVFLRAPKATGAGHAAASVSDAAVSPPESPPDAAPTANDETSIAIARARSLLLADTNSDLRASHKALSDLEGPPATALLVLAQTKLALAQHRMMESSLTSDPKAARGHHRAARKLAVGAYATAEGLVNAVDADLSKADRAAAWAASAEAMRLQGKNHRQIERQLRRAESLDEFGPAVQLARARLLLAQNRTQAARRILDKLAAAPRSRDVRANYQIALMEFLADRRDEAGQAVDSVLALAPNHEGAKSLKGRMGGAPAQPVTNTPEETTTDTPEKTATTAPEKTTTTAPEKPAPEKTATNAPEKNSTGASYHRPSGDSYDRLLSKADSKAEAGNCRAALKLYERALDKNPGSVAALTGAAYCHLDLRDFSRAHRRFRAALSISPRYRVALYGRAEAFQQQGLKRDAIEAFKKYLRYYPSGRRSDMARRQIDRLGGSVTPPEPTQPVQPSDPPPAKPSDTSPTEAPTKPADPPPTEAPTKPADPPPSKPADTPPSKPADSEPKTVPSKAAEPAQPIAQ